MNKPFNKELLQSCICSESQLKLARKYGSRYEYEERGKTLVCYLYQGKYYLEGGDENV